MSSQSINVTDGQTDGQTDRRHAIAVVHRAVKTRIQTVKVPRSYIWLLSSLYMLYIAVWTHY